ncbi:MAG: UvrD-helicase domain-containing protein [Nitrospirae bacterium]|nr:UvrD-helicase domain-containing protein [Nitrospirota bacterium]
MKDLSDAEDRRLAVTTFDKNIVVTAGAGTGKTTLLVERILHLLMREPDPLRITDIVALTFTNKAANEMKIRLKERLQGLISTPVSQGTLPDEDPLLQDLRERYGLSREKIEARAHDASNDLEMAQIGTMHSFAGHILRLYPIEARMDPKFQEDDGSEFEAHFVREWEGWLDVELSSESPRRGLWKRVLHSIGLESLESFAKELCRENIPVPRLLLYFDNQAQSYEVERWLREMRNRAERLLSVYTKTRKVEQFLKGAYDLLDHLLSKKEGVPVMEGTLSGTPPSGWSEEDFREAKQIIRTAKGISSADVPFFRSLLELLFPFVTETRRRFTASGYISFDGLLTSCRDLLKTHLRVRGELKQRFKALLVDEFQDTDPIQYEIILYLSEIPGHCEAEWHKIQLTPGKLFIVGDPKQSIYAFRRADIEAYSRVVEMIISGQGGIQAALSTNFRSHDRIIDVVNELCGHLIRRRELLQPEYIPLMEHPDHKAGLSGQRVELRIVDGRGVEDMDASMASRCEAEAIGRWLKEEVIGKETLMDSKGGKALVSPRHVALLFRKLTEVYEYLEVLRRYEIPYIVEGERHFFGTQEVIDFVNLLKAIDNPFDRVALVGVLRSPLGGLSDREIYELGKGGFDRGLPEEPHMPIRGAKEHGNVIPAQAGIQNADSGLDSHFRGNDGLLPELCSILRRLHQETGTMSLTDAIHHIFDSLPMLEFAASSYQGEQAVANLMKIQRIAESLSTRSNLTLKGFTTLLETKVTGMEEEGESPLAEETVDAVRVLSIHKAKGLEFPLVILAGMHSSLKGGEDQVSVIHDWSRDEVGFKVEGFRNPAAVMLQERGLVRDEEEQKRLLYVAMTRARECLVLSGTLYGRANRGSFLSLVTEGMGEAVGERSSREIETGKGRIRQSVIDVADCIPNYSSKKPRKSGGKDQRPEARGNQYGDVVPEEIGVFADLWESRDHRYATIRSKSLFVTPSGLKEAAEAKPAPKKTEAAEGDRAARERSMLIGTIAHAVLEQWDFGRDPALFKHTIDEACLKFIPTGNPPYSPFRKGGKGGFDRGFSDKASSILTELYEIFDSFSASPAYDELRRATIIGREVPFVIPWGGQVMNGVIDLIYREGERLYIADYKTDKISEGDVAEKIKGYALSGKIYMEAVRRSLRQEVSGFKLIFLRLGRAINLTTGAE